MGFCEVEQMVHRGEVKKMEKAKNYVYPLGCDSAKVIQVIETKSARGAGTNEQPSRMVTQYWSLDGQFLAEIDDLPSVTLEDC